MNRLPEATRYPCKLYLTKGEYSLIVNRAKKLDGTPNWYVMQLVEMDIKTDLLSKSDEAEGLVFPEWDEASPPSDDELTAEEIANELTAEEVAKRKDQARKRMLGRKALGEVDADVSDSFAENIRKSAADASESQPSPGPEQETQGRPPMRPRMKSIADMKRQAGFPGVNQSPVGKDPRMPAESPAERRAASKDPDWRTKIFNAMRNDQSSERTLRKEILESLPPEEDLPEDPEYPPESKEANADADIRHGKAQKDSQAGQGSTQGAEG